MRTSHMIMGKRTGNPKLRPRQLHLYYLTYILSCLYFLLICPATVHSSSPPINQRTAASGGQAVRGTSSLNTRSGIENAGSSTPLILLLVSATSSSSASVPTSLAASSSTLGLLASSTDQELDNETINDQPVTKIQSSAITVGAAAVQPKGSEVLASGHKSDSDLITANKRGSFKCGNGTLNCNVHKGTDSVDKEPKEIIVASTTKGVVEEENVEEEKSDVEGKRVINEKNTKSDAHSEKAPAQLDKELPSSSMAQSKTTTITDKSTHVESSTTTPQPTTTVVSSTSTSSSSSTTTVAIKKTTVSKGTTSVPTTPVPSSPNPTPPPRGDYIYQNAGDLSEYTEYSDARFAEERRRDQNNSASLSSEDHSHDIGGDDLDLYDMEKDMNPTEGAAYERTRPNRTNMSTGTGSVDAGPNRRDEFLQQANLTGKYNVTTNKQQVFFPEHFPQRKMKHRTWFAQQHRLGRHGMGPIDDGPFSSLIWKDKKYLISVLVPIGVGIAGAVVFVVAAYATRSCRGAPHTFIPTVGTDLFLQHVHSRNDDIFLLMETTDDEM